MRTILLTHQECEHTGDIERDHKALKAVGLRFKEVYSWVADGPEVGVSLIATEATDEELSKALRAHDGCAGGGRPGTRQEAEEWIDEEEGYYEMEHSEDDDEW